MKILFLFCILVSFNTFAFFDIQQIDPNKIAPQIMLKEAIDYLNSHPGEFSHTEVLTLINFKEHNSKERMYVIDLRTGDVEKYLVAHGKNSDKNFDGFAESFSNTNNSLQSSLGFYKSAETYYGDNGYSLRLDGLSTTNSNARERAIVIHGADYVKPGSKIGRSYGCPAVEQRFHQYLIDRLKNGSLIYASLE